MVSHENISTFFYLHKSSTSDIESFMEPFVFNQINYKSFIVYRPETISRWKIVQLLYNRGIFMKYLIKWRQDRLLSGLYWIWCSMKIPCTLCQSACHFPILLYLTIYVSKWTNGRAFLLFELWINLLSINLLLSLCWFFHLCPPIFEMKSEFWTLYYLTFAFVYKL